MPIFAVNSLFEQPYPQVALILTFISLGGTTNKCFLGRSTDNENPPKIQPLRKRGVGQLLLARDSTLAFLVAYRHSVDASSGGGLPDNQKLGGEPKSRHSRNKPYVQSCNDRSLRRLHGTPINSLYVLYAPLRGLRWGAIHWKPPFFKGHLVSHPMTK